MDYKSIKTHTKASSRRAQPAARKERDGSQVQPGLRRILVHWFGSGRIFSLFLFLATIGILVFCFTSPRFHIRQVQVQGNNALQADNVIDLSQLEGMPIWFVDHDMSVQRLLQNAYVEQVRVTVALPDRANIAIVERKPEVRWQVGNVQFLVDHQGTVLDMAQELPEPGTLVIVDTTPHTLQPRDRVDVDAIKLAQALALRLPAELGFTPASIGWDFGLGVFVTSDSGQTIVFGQSHELDRKLAVLKYLLNDGTAFTYLDLRPSNPFYQNTGAGS